MSDKEFARFVVTKLDKIAQEKYELCIKRNRCNKFSDNYKKLTSKITQKTKEFNDAMSIFRGLNK